jgi:dihydrodipicolinate synthase/N-acetylneuraminate lyase
VGGSANSKELGAEQKRRDGTVLTTGLGSNVMSGRQPTRALPIMHLFLWLVILMNILVMASSWTSPLKGIVTPLATPLLEQDIIDKEGTRRLIEHVIAGGVAGIFVLGSSGEGPSLSYAARKEFIQYCCQVVAQRISVLVSISDTAFSETIALAEVAHKAGASAVVLTTPYYFSMSQSELFRYATRVAESIPQNMALLLYNIPFLTKESWSVETVQQLAEQHENIVGIKDSSGDLQYFEKLCKTLKEKRPDFTVMIGPEHLLPQAVQAGGDGGINGGSNIFPALFVSLYNALTAKERDETRVKKLTAQVDALQRIYQVGTSKENPFSRFIVGTKCALAGEGICSSTFVNQPFTTFTESQMGKMKQILAELKSSSCLEEDS